VIQVSVSSKSLLQILRSTYNLSTGDSIAATAPQQLAFNSAKSVPLRGFTEYVGGHVVKIMFTSFPEVI